MAPRFQHRWRLHIALFLLTVGTTSLLGIKHYVEFASDFGTRMMIPDQIAARGFFAAVGWMIREYWTQGVLYSASVLGILGAHEMGHYVACRRYDVDATLPFFLPFPSLSGTLGAVIKIREAFPSRTALFDIAVWGPIAGFVVTVPLLFWGMHLSNVLPLPANLDGGYDLGEPLLLKLVAHLYFGPVPDGYSINLHPVAFAAWFGMLATAWNLLPFGQLDGGHLTYSTLGDTSRHFSIATVAAAIVMCFISASWIVMTLMMVVMLFTLGPRHPRVIAEYEPLGPGRYALAAFALFMLIVCFTPVPINPLK